MIFAINLETNKLVLFLTIQNPYFWIGLGVALIMLAIEIVDEVEGMIFAIKLGIAFFALLVAIWLSYSIGSWTKANELNVELAKIHNGSYFKANGKLYRAVEMINQQSSP